MKRFLYLLVIIVVIFTSCQKKVETTNDEVKTDVLKIYSYDTFATFGLGTKVAEEFEKLYDCKAIIEVVGEGAALLNRVIYEKGNPQADIVVGIQNTQLNKALAANVFLPYEPENIKNIKDQSLLVDKRHRLIPYDYSYYAFVYDSNAIPNPPKTFAEMQGSIWKDKIILIDPRTSATGYGLLIWSLGIANEKGFDIFWSSLRDNVLTTFSNWSEAYMAFQTGEAPIVLSYATSPAYHIEEEGTYRYKAYIPEEGGLKEIEFAGILQGAKNLYLARRFMDFMLTPVFQQYIPTTQWMYPSIDGIDLPPGFAASPQPRRDLSEAIYSRSDNFSDKWLEQWSILMAK